MHRLASLILGVVVLFVVVVAGTLVARKRTVRVEPTGPAPAAADLQIKQVQIEEQSGNIRWRLTADLALIYEREGRTAMRKVAVSVFEPDRTWTIVGREGDLFQPAKDVELRGDVVVTSSDGTRLETSVLRWQNGTRRLWTDAPVVISRDRALIHGTNLEVQMADQAMAVGGRVHALFEQGKRS